MKCAANKTPQIPFHISNPEPPFIFVISLSFIDLFGSGSRFAFSSQFTISHCSVGGLTTTSKTFPQMERQVEEKGQQSPRRRFRISLLKVYCLKQVFSTTLQRRNKKRLGFVKVETFIFAMHLKSLHFLFHQSLTPHLVN
ncbi:hypothetical protein HanPI659440_Chr15g0609181 [Helianthus annuus]|nr:hypothetical protein HanPI659440_Chr15g0609181 [Helianthus annuus]